MTSLLSGAGMADNEANKTKIFTVRKKIIDKKRIVGYKTHPFALHWA
jgi:hypothetical protein